MSAHTLFPAANAKYAENFPHGHLTERPEPSRQLIVVTCMDARLDPAAHLGLKEGDAHVIRTAGGSAREAVRSIIVSQRLLGTREIAVFHHTRCGMTNLDTDDLRARIMAEHPGEDREVVAAALAKIDFFPLGDLEDSVEADVKFLREHPLVLKGTVITGWEYHVETGRIEQVVCA